MSKQDFGSFTSVLIILVCALLVCVLAPQGMATESGLRLDKSSKAGGGGNGSFAVSGLYTGTIGDRITLGEREYLIPDKTPVFMVGEGLIQKGVFVVKRSLFVTGRNRDGVAVAHIVIVHRSAPAGREAATEGPSDQVGTSESEGDTDREQ